MRDVAKNNLRALGFDKEVENVENNKCPFCGKEVHEEDFRDPLSRKEFKISGLCQRCQDKAFGEE